MGAAFRPQLVNRDAPHALAKEGNYFPVAVNGGPPENGMRALPIIAYSVCVPGEGRAKPFQTGHRQRGIGHLARLRIDPGRNVLVRHSRAPCMEAIP